MAPSNSPHKLFPFRGIVHRTEAPCHRLAPVKKYRSMVDILKTAKFAVIESLEEDYSNSNCVQCGNGDRPDEILLCDNCDRGFHMTCLRPVVVRVPIGAWFCPDCSVHPTARVKCFSQRKIVDFFKLNKGGIVKRNCSSPSPSLQDGKKRRKRSIIMKKKRRRLQPFVPVEDQGRRLEQMRSLASALTAYQIEFSNELTYSPRMAPRSANRADLEDGGMQVLSREDTETLETCLAMFRQGQFPPLLVVYDSLEGFTVEADSNIKDLTLLSEYTGDVDYIKNRERDDCDSMMTLLLAKDTSDSLVICPDKRGNIARFVSGINNHIPDGKKKQNVKCVRYNVKGECRVLLVATRDIAKGERLYYDYNGYEHMYPTHHFV